MVVGFNIYYTLVVIYNVMYIRHTGGIHDMIYIGDGWKCMIYILDTLVVMYDIH